MVCNLIIDYNVVSYCDRQCLWTSLPVLKEFEMTSLFFVVNCLVMAQQLTLSLVE